MDYLLTIFSLLSGFFLFLSFPKFGSFIFGWFCFVPLFFIILLYKNLKTLKLAFVSFLCGIIGYGGILYWIVPTFKAAGENIIFGILALLLLSLYCSVYLFIFCLFINLNRSNPFFCLSSSLFWIILEYIRTHVFSGFPWSVLGYSQHNNLALIQIAEFSGVYGVSFLVIFFNLSVSALLADFFSKKKVKYSIIKFFLSLLLVSVSLLYGKIRIKEIEDSKIVNHLTVAILQGNIDQYKKWDKNFVEEIKNKYTDLVNSAYENLTKEKNKNNVVLWLWPESSVPGWLFEEKELFNWVSKILEKTNNKLVSYHLIGTVRTGGNTEEYYNSCVLLKYCEKTIVEDIYDKIHLVPFGEYVPFRKALGKFIKVVNELGEFTSGKKFTIFKIKGVKFGCLICYESIFPELTKKFVNLGADFLINITNDAWFLKTSAPYQHFIFNIFRAVENRVFVLRSANTGISAIIKPTGYIVKKTNLFEDDTIIYDMNIPKLNKTFYTKYGEFLWIFYILIFLLTTRINIYKNNVHL